MTLLGETRRAWRDVPHLLGIVVAMSASASIVILLLLFTLHEYAHALAANTLGDNTARQAGRLTLKPRAHLYPFGSLVLRRVLLWRHSDVVFGWAKPVPMDTSKLANPQRDQRVVSFAGPGINLAVALASGLLLASLFVLMRRLAPGTVALRLAAPFSAMALTGSPASSVLLVGIALLKDIMYTSVVLGVFNLLPIPPLMCWGFRY